MNYAITIGRQFGSGGREIGQRVAQLLNIDYYDKELLTEAANASGLNAKIFEAADEKTPKLFANFGALNIGYNSGAYYFGTTPISHSNIYAAQSRVIEELAQRGPCVIVGRTADYILRKHTTVISTFVHSSIEDRVQRIIARGDCETPKQATELAEKKNKLRADYYKFYTGAQWGNAENYDLCVNSSILGTEGAAQFIVQFAKTIIEKLT
ncbi:MAG: cytidylate kinase-like family protein [Muribaculaceae bacterium]|nr:cytidylate kinase-like family protein [Muribaculaceae bacterium]